MSHILHVAKKASVVRHAGKLVAVAASSGAALVTMFSALYSFGVIGERESHQSIGNLGAAWVGLRPSVDTATAIGDTVHYAATVTDKNGSILVGARPTWTTGDSTVATVGTDGSVIALGPGRTMVSVVVGKLVAHSRIFVQQRVTVVEVARVAGDSTITVPEGNQLQLRARALDSRRNLIAGVIPTWHVDDTTIAVLDSGGILTGRYAGRTMVSAKIEGVSGRSGVSIVTPATAIALVAGSSQHSLAGAALPQAIVVRATNRRGAPATGKVVTFKLSDGQGSVQPATARTDADGRARAAWTLGAYPGRQTLLASVENVDSALAIVAEADPVASNTRVIALVEHYTGKAGEALADSVGVRVTDSTGRVLADVPVRWTPIDGGSVDAIVPRTDSLGVAWSRWTLSRRTGTQRIRAQVGSGPASRSIAPVTISATALAGAPASLVLESGDNQRAAAGAKLPKPIVIRVVDANGSGVADVQLDLSPSGGTLPDNVLRTDSLGLARTRWTMGRSAAAYTLAVHADGVKKLLKLTAQARSAAPANLSFEDVPARSKAGKPAAKTKRLYALVTDLYGNPVPDAKVSFSATSGTVSPKRAVSDAQGRAALTWKVGAKPGEQTLTGVVRATDVKGEYATEVPGQDPAAKIASLKPSAK